VSTAYMQANLTSSRFAWADVRLPASPPAHILSPSAIRLHTFTSARSTLAHVLRQVFLVVGAEPTHVCSFVTHFFAHDTPAPAAKQLAKSVWNCVEQVLPSVPALRQSLKALLACRMQAAVASLNRCGSSVVEVDVLLVVVVFTVFVVVGVWAAARPACPKSTVPATITAVTTFDTRNIPVSICEPRFLRSPATVVLLKPLRARGGTTSGVVPPCNLARI